MNQRCHSLEGGNSGKTVRMNNQEDMGVQH